MRRQAALAGEHGVDGFVMHHYWFDGRKLLDTPLRNLLDDPTIEFPFALCWANENWTRRWDGLDSDVLIAQSYSEGWADRFYDDILPALNDPRYITVEGRPLLVLYRIGHVKNARAAIERWKERARRRRTRRPPCPRGQPFPPFRGTAARRRGRHRRPRPLPAAGRHRAPVGQEPRPRDVLGPLKGDVYSYDAAVNGADLTTTGPARAPRPSRRHARAGTTRRGAETPAYVFHGANPLSFRRWLARASAAALAGGGTALLFVNAWNEWAEGAHLEPDARFGRAYLEAVRDAVGVDQRAPISTAPVPAESVAG